MIHADCGGNVVFDMSGGFCEWCHVENLNRDECEEIPDDLDA